MKRKVPAPVPASGWRAKLRSPSRAMGMRPLLPRESSRPAPLEVGTAAARVGRRELVADALGAMPLTPPLRAA